MLTTHNLKIDLVRPAILPPVTVVQGDTYTREVQISLYAAGVAWELPEGHDVAIRYSKPDGTAGVYDTLPDGSMAWQSEGNTVKIMLCPQMLTAPGMVPTQVAIILGDSIVSTFAFFVDVKADAGNGAMMSENYVNWRSAYLPQLTGAKVGQYIEITEVDEKGRVLGCRAVNAPAGGGYGGGNLDMRGSELDNVGTLVFAGPDNTATNGARMEIDDVFASADGAVYPVINHYSNDNDHPVIYRNIANGVEDRDAVNLYQLKTRLVAPLTASVGQYIKITAVDDDGKITAVEAVDAPGGSGGGVHVGPDEPTDENVNVWIDLDDDETKVFVEAPVTAAVGQTIVVKAVDENSKPTAWEAVDFPSGGGGSGDKGLVAHIETTQEVDSIALNTDVDGNPLNLVDGMYLVSIAINGTASNTSDKSIVLTVNNIAVATATEAAMKDPGIWSRTEYMVDTITGAVWGNCGVGRNWFYGTPDKLFDSVNGNPVLTRRWLSSKFAEFTSLKVHGGVFGVGTYIDVWRL